MSTSAPIEPNTPNSTPALDIPFEPPFEEKVRQFWEKNSKTIYALCALAILVIVGKNVMDTLEENKQDAIKADYAAATTSEKLKSFANTNSDHLLGATAQLRLADEAYSAGKYTDAAASYQKAATTFKTGPFASRATLGAAISKIYAGQTADGEESLKKLSTNTIYSKVIRAEAAFHLGSLAQAANRTEDAAKYFDQVASIAPDSSWAQRASLQRGELSVTSK